jgi:hypothetical protein
MSSEAGNSPEVGMSMEAVSSTADKAADKYIKLPDCPDVAGYPRV